jgi:hypothetical protein
MFSTIILGTKVPATFRDFAQAFQENDAMTSSGKNSVTIYLL